MKSTDTTPTPEELVERLRDISRWLVEDHNHVAPTSCDYAADRIAALTKPVEGLETTAEERNDLAIIARVENRWTTIDVEVRAGIGRLLRDHATLTARLAAAEALRDEHFAEIKRAQQIINELKAWRERVLTNNISADWINVMLSEDARVENGRLENGPYLAVKIAEQYEVNVAAERTAREALEARLAAADQHRFAWRDKYYALEKGLIKP